MSRPWLVPAANMTMRGAALAGRFALSIYMARMLGYDALGAFGLIAGLAGIAPALLGFGVSYHVNRDLLVRPRDEAYRLLRDRMALSLAAAAALWAVGGIGLALGLLPRPPGLWTGAAIVTLELVAFDLHIALINLGRPVAANSLLFVRSAGWIAPVVALGLADPRLRTLDMVLAGWLAALVLSFALLPPVLRDAPFAALRRTPVDWRGLAERARRTPLVYLNDLAETGQVYLDRFVVAQILGLAAAGIYTFCFSVTHGLYVLAAAAVTQLSMPRLMAARDTPGAWAGILAREGRRAAAVAVPLAAAAALAALVVLPALGIAEFRREPMLFALMLAVAVVRPFADLARIGLYGLGADRVLARVNLAGAALSLAAGVAALLALGLAGIGVSALATQAALILARRALLRRHLARRG